VRRDWWCVQTIVDALPLAAFPLYISAVDYVDHNAMRDVEIVRVSVTFGSSLQWSVGRKLWPEQRA
jgi:hypothetical protein